MRQVVTNVTCSRATETVPDSYSSLPPRKPTDRPTRSDGDGMARLLTTSLLDTQQSPHALRAAQNEMISSGQQQRVLSLSGPRKRVGRYKHHHTSPPHSGMHLVS